MGGSAQVQVFAQCHVVSNLKSATVRFSLIARLFTMHAGEQRVCINWGDLQLSAHTACMRVAAVFMLPEPSRLFRGTGLPLKGLTSIPGQPRSLPHFHHLSHR